MPFSLLIIVTDEMLLFQQFLVAFEQPRAMYGIDVIFLRLEECIPHRIVCTLR